MNDKLDLELLDEQLNQRLARTGLRPTAQRRHVYNVLLQKRDHPSAEEVFIRAKQTMPEISMATVYNCLDTLVHCGLVRQVNLERGATRYCSNMNEHHHFYCDLCGCAFDIDPVLKATQPRLHVPIGFKVRRFEISVRGLCPACASTSPKPAPNA